MEEWEPVPIKRQRHDLRALEEALESSKNWEFTENDLGDFKIDAKQVTLDKSGKACPAFPFFTPSQAKHLPAINEKRMAMEFPTYDPTPVQYGPSRPMERARASSFYFLGYVSLCSTDLKEEEKGQWSSKDEIDYDFHLDLLEMKPHEWEVIWISDIIDSQEYPHLLSFLIYDIDGNPRRLLRGELLVIIRLMRGQLETVQFQAFAKAPILLFSFMGPQRARILHAYFEDDGTLVVRYTRFYDFKTRNDEEMEILARWALAEPTGDTKEFGSDGRRILGNSGLEYGLADKSALLRGGHVMAKSFYVEILSS
ncbi:hypothetical protein B7463_g6048, partial [Scytalidium lignicola]